MISAADDSSVLLKAKESHQSLPFCPPRWRFGSAQSIYGRRTSVMQLTSMTVQTVFQNLLVAALPGDELEYLLAHLEPVTLNSEDSIYVQDDPINYIYFPLDCIVSSLAIMSN